ncbi:MAG: hypothetical protein AB1689_29190 [Thermodesulfobacteriota bacterium]
MRAGTCALLLLWLVLAGIWAGTRPALGDDMWWVLATGRHIVESGAIPEREIFSFSAPGQPWYHQEWLSHVLFYSALRAFGGDGLVLLKVAIAVVIVVLLGVVAARRSGSPFLGALAAAFAAWACRDDLDVRAKIFTVLCSVLMLGLVNAYRRAARPRILLLAPLLMVAWANLHYGFVYGLVILGSYFGAETVKSLTGLPDAPMPLRRSLLLGAALLLAAVACLANPQPLGSFEIALEHMRPDNPWRRVIEWKPPPLFRQGVPTAFAVTLAVQTVAAASALLVARRRFDVADLALVVATAAVALQSRRFAPLLAFVATPFLARNLALVVERVARARPRLARAGPALAAAGALAGTILTGVALASQARAAFAPGLFAGMTHLSSFPVDAVSFLRANPLPGERLYNFYAWGGYLLFHLPGVPIYVDGRAAVAYPPRIADEYRTIERGGRAALARLAGYDANVVLHHVGYDLPLRLRRAPGWVRVYDDGHAVIFVRRTPETASWLERFERGELVYPDTPGAQLFLAELEMQRGHRQAAVARVLDVVRRFPRDGMEAALRRQRAELQAGITTDQSALRTIDLYAAAFERLSRP